jgi:hypothetical protein
VEGVIYSKAQETLRAPPPWEGGGGSPPRLIIEAIRIAFVVHAVEAVGADHRILVVHFVEGVARTRGRGVVDVVEQLVTDEGGSGEGRG